MGMVVQHNMSAMNANRNLGVTAGNLAKSTEKLSSGYKINRAGDNAAGLAISEKMRGQIRGLDQASSNAEDGISMIQTAEGALTETHSILQRMRELAVQASSDTNTDDDRTQIQNEIDQLTQEVDRIATTTEFNTKKLIDGSAKGAVTEKAGKASVDSTFANSNVSAEITTDSSKKAAFTDVIRIEVTEDFSAGKSTANSNKYTETELEAALVAGGTTGAGAKSTDLATAKTTNATALDGKTTALQDAKNDVTKAEDDLKEAIKASLAGAVTDTTNAKAGALNKGISEEDLQKAVDAYVDAYVDALGSNGSTATGTQVTAADTALKALYAADAGTKNSGTATQDDVIAKIKALSDKKAALVTAQSEYDTAKKNSDIVNDDELVGAYIAKKQADKALAAETKGTEAYAKAEENAKNAEKALDEVNKSKSVLNVTDLFGNSSDTSKFEISSKVDEDNNLTLTLKNKEGDDTVITISNADKMKAGDVITITAKEMVETEQAPTGKDAFRLQVGANAGQEVMLGINSMKAKDLNIVQTKDGVEGKALDVTNQASASLAVNAYDMAIQSVSTERAKLGATQNRLEHTISNLDTSSENLQSAESSLRDTDMAEEMTRYSKSNILQQAGQSMLAQANQSTQGVLNLLG